MEEEEVFGIRARLANPELTADLVESLEADFDVFNSETFGETLSTDWEQGGHEELATKFLGELGFDEDELEAENSLQEAAHVLESVPLSTMHLKRANESINVGNIDDEDNIFSQIEDTLHQLVLDDEVNEEELLDPAIVNRPRSKPVPVPVNSVSSSNYASSLQYHLSRSSSSPPPGLLTPDATGSPLIAGRSIWAMGEKERRASMEQQRPVAADIPLEAIDPCILRAKPSSNTTTTNGVHPPTSCFPSSMAAFLASARQQHQHQLSASNVYQSIRGTVPSSSDSTPILRQTDQDASSDLSKILFSFASSSVSSDTIPPPPAPIPEPPSRSTPTSATLQALFNQARKMQQNSSAVQASSAHPSTTSASYRPLPPTIPFPAPKTRPPLPSFRGAGTPPKGQPLIPMHPPPGFKAPPPGLPQPNTAVPPPLLLQHHPALGRTGSGPPLIVGGPLKKPLSAVSSLPPPPSKKQEQKFSHRYRGWGSMTTANAAVHYSQGGDDSYAGLMTLKERTWLVSVQLTQLATKHPFRDDYFYSLYSLKKRKEDDETRTKLVEELFKPELNSDLPSVYSNATSTSNANVPERSLGRFSQVTALCPRMIVDVTGPITTGQQTSLLLEIEELFPSLLELEEAQLRLTHYKSKSESHEEEVRRETETIRIATAKFQKLLDSQPQTVKNYLTVRKGRRILSRLLPHLPSPRSVLFPLIKAALKNLGSVCSQPDVVELIGAIEAFPATSLLLEEVMELISATDNSSRQILTKLNSCFSRGSSKSSTLSNCSLPLPTGVLSPSRLPALDGSLIFSGATDFPIQFCARLAAVLRCCVVEGGVLSFCVVVFLCHGRKAQDYDEESESTKEPEFLSKPVNITAKRDQTVVLPCQLDELGSFAALWWHENQLLFASSVQINKDPRLSVKNNDLTIQGVMPKDSGTYHCNISTSVPKALTHHLLVEQEPKVRAVEKEVIEAKGRPATLACSVTQGVPTPQVSWQKDGKDLSWQGPEVSIENVDKINGGKYTCIASNGVGAAASDTIHLTVLYPPEIKVQEEWIHSGEGYQAEIACIISGEPKPDVEWYRDNKRLDVSSSGGQYKVSNEGSAYTLQIDQLRENDFGQYACLAKNQQGQDKKEIELSGIAKSVNFTSPPNGDSPTMYRITWEVESYSPVTAFQFKYRKVKYNETVDTPGEWMEESVDPESASERFVHQKTVKLNDLSPATQYEAVVQVKNKFGWNKESEPFRFATLGAEVPQPEPNTSGAVSLSCSVIAPFILFVALLSSV
ncbi:unnamed protein product [Cyprideis torosa]|uniref:Uncharacterized protein n=1 Tax=Cyprideis torosa TaxID=163714 RepID=A0A7R8WAD8_9CRUS|nr:unnamed protein product [Cyprideis torosa]CAG0885381.1 unnamed protein product [Cyprideis torosa]